MAASTSRAAPLMSRLMANWMTTCALPTLLCEVSSFTPAMVARRRSSGSATVEAMISGLAPAMVACTAIDRQGDVRQGRNRHVKVGEQPGQRDGDREERCRDRPPDEKRRNVHAGLPARGLARLAAKALGNAVEHQIDDRRREQGEHLAHQQAADDGESQRPAQLGARAVADEHRQGAEHRGERRHQDRPEAQHRGLENRLLGRFAVLALGLEGEVDDHDGVLLDDADQQHDADDADHIEVAAGDHQREQRAEAGRGQRRRMVTG